MGFLKNFFTNVFHEEARVPTRSSFDRLSDEELETHLAVSTYDGFHLTDAVRPSYNLQVVPREGYRHEEYRDEETHSTVPVLMGAASREFLFEVFMELLEPLGNVVDVVLETSHGQGGNGHSDLYREHIDMPVLKSILWDYEDLLTNDGCTGIAVLNPQAPHEVQFDEHKLLIVYSHSVADFEQVLQSRGLPCDESIKFITEAEHVHSSSDAYHDQLDELKTQLGMDAVYS
jgi:hypothetical protein